MYNLMPTTFDPMHIMQEADLVFFATSSGVSKDLAQDFIQAKFPVIDLPGDFRLPADIYKKWYKNEPTSDEAIQRAHFLLLPLLHKTICLIKITSSLMLKADYLVLANP